MYWNFFFNEQRTRLLPSSVKRREDNYFGCSHQDHLSFCEGQRNQNRSAKDSEDVYDSMYSSTVRRSNNSGIQIHIINDSAACCKRLTLTPQRFLPMQAPPLQLNGTIPACVDSTTFRLFHSEICRAPTDALSSRKAGALLG